MNLDIADLANHDLKNATRVLYYSANVLKNLPQINADQDAKTAIYTSAKLAILAVQHVLANVAAQIDFIANTEV